MATATAETVQLGARNQQPQPESCPIIVTEKAAKEVMNIIFEQRVGALADLAPDLVATYKGLRTTNAPPTLTDLVAATGQSEEALVNKLGAAAAGDTNHLTNEFRDAFRDFQTANKRPPSSSELAAQAGVPESELVAKLGNAAAGILRLVYLRLRVVGGGCSGFENKLDLDPQANPKLDDTFETHGIHVVVDRRSLMYSSGTTVNFHDEINRRGFSITNPAAKSTCGCGSSFSM